jgi:hypothetical protein
MILAEQLGLMVMTSLAWNLKAWFGTLAQCSTSSELIKMEFRRFYMQSFGCRPRSCERADVSSTAS